MSISIRGSLDARTTPRAWREVLPQLASGAAPYDRLVISASGLTHCDGAGLGLLLELERRARATGKPFEIAGLDEKLRRVLDLYSLDKLTTPVGAAKGRRPIEELGKAAVEVWHYIRDVFAFIGELTVEAATVVRHPRQLRWRDTLMTVEKAGSDALPIIALLGTLFGLILAFQGAMPMKKFGAELYVADLVAISLLRELGPILTAIILAGRSGSAFAAELGTMKVNDEISALKTMGLSPLRFLALPRIVAGVFVAPLLTIFCNLVGLIGAAIVVSLLGYPLVTYVNQVVSAVTYLDLLNGLIKAAVFGLLVSSIGCMQGLNTGTGASAVGESTTRSVVSGLVLIIVADGVFAVVTYALGI